jgi:Na+/proline symporter
VGLSVIFFAPLAQRIKDVMPKGVTSGEFFRLRYGRNTWSIYFILSVAYLFAFLVTQSMGAGLVLDAVFGIPYNVGMVTITLVCVAYTMMGGLRSVIAMDFINTVLIMACLVIVVPISITKIGIADIYSGIMTNAPERMEVLQPIGLVFIFSAPVFAVGEIFHSNLWWLRAHAMKTKNVRKTWLAGGFIWMFVPILAGMTGLIQLGSGIAPEHLNMIFPHMAVKVLGGAGAFLVTVLVLASISSTLDSLLAGTSSLFAEDIYREIINPKAPDRRINFVQRLMIFLLGLASIVLAWYKVGTLGQILYFSGAFICSMIWPIVYGLYDKTVSAAAANLSMIVGTIAGVLTNIYISPFGGPTVAGFVSFVVFMVVCKAKPDNFDWNRLNREYP